MYINKRELHNGLNPYIHMEEGTGHEVGMDVALLVLERGETYRESNAGKEAAFPTPPRRRFSRRGISLECRTRCH